MGKDLPDFASDFIQLFFKHFEKFIPGKKIDPRNQLEKNGYGQRFFHAHAEGEKCHLDVQEVKK